MQGGKLRGKGWYPTENTEKITKKRDSIKKK